MTSGETFKPYSGSYSCEASEKFFKDREAYLKWQPDDAAAACSCCFEVFTWSNRSRACGKIILPHECVPTLLLFLPEVARRELADVAKESWNWPWE